MKYRDILGFSKKQPKKKVVKEQKKSTVVDAIKEEFGLNEGPAYEYANIVKKIERAENQQAKEVNNLVKLLGKKGLKPIARLLDKSYSGVEKYWKFYHKILDKLQ